MTRISCRRRLPALPLAAAVLLSCTAGTLAAQAPVTAPSGVPAAERPGVPAAPRAGVPVGFAPQRAAEQLRCEAVLQQLPTAAAFREHMRSVTAEPHPTGSDAQRRVADYLATAMERAGLRVERAAYDVYLPQLDGLVNELEIVTPVRMALPNREPALDADPFSAHPELLPGWNAYSGSGDVTAEVVYVNFGRKEDFEELQRLGVSVTGRVVLARYGGNFRGFKVQFAQEHGAAAVIMFSDPGTSELVSYPDGPGLTPFTIQRGSVLTLPWTGDPLTPFEPALPFGTPEGDAVQRLDPDDVAFHEIPVLPIGYAAAQEILGRMTGADVPATWRGGLPVAYRLTGGPALTVRVHVRQRLDFTRAVNVIGWIDGSEFPDEWVILGSHHDAWGFGAHDPNGGTAMLLTLADALGRMAADGCRPRRSIAIAHWDAEEYGIIGSTEWVEHHRDALGARAVAYINADGAITGGDFSASASPSLKQPILDAARAVRYAAGDSTVYDHWMRRARDRAEPPIGDLGGGSDHVAFYTHVGVPSMGLSLGGANGIYHSNYDTFAFFERFSDPDFVFGPTLARVDGVLALRLANADAIPYDVMRYGIDIERHAADLEELAAGRGMGLRLDSLKHAAAAFRTVAAELDAARTAWLERGPDAAAVRELSTRLIALEKAFIDMAGLQGRPWSRSLYASPDPFSGYASWMLPGIRFEIETDNAPGALAWEARYVVAVRELQRRVQHAAASLAVPSAAAAASPTTASPAAPRAAARTEAPSRWGVSVDLGFNGSRGNTALTVFSTGIGVKHLVTDEFRLEWNGAVRYGESEGDVVARNLRSQVSFDFNPDADVSPFFYMDAERDPFRRMRLRTDGGAGAKYTFWRQRNEEVSLSVAGLYSRQEFFPLPSGELTPRRSNARWSGRGRVRRQLGTARVEHTSFMQPVLDQLSDYTYDATTRLSTKLNERVSLTLTHLYKHNSQPPPGVVREDQSIQAGITVQF
jgi:N-acetylated-alpha-linked acidic dipeptidase